MNDAIKEMNKALGCLYLAVEPSIADDVIMHVRAGQEAIRASTLKESVGLVAKVLEVAQLHDDTDEGGMVDMPDEGEWGEIVGLARKLARP